MSRRIIYYAGKEYWEPETKKWLNANSVPKDNTLVAHGKTGAELWLGLNDLMVAAKTGLSLSLGSETIKTRIACWYPVLLGTTLGAVTNLADITKYTGSIVGGVTIDESGMQGNGTNGRMNTNCSMFLAKDHTSITATSTSLHVLSKTNNNALMCDIGVIDNGAGTQYDMAIYTRNGGNLITRLGSSGVNNSTTMADSLGFFSTSRRSSGQYKQLKGGSVVATITQAANTGNFNREFLTVGALNNDGSVIQFSSRKLVHPIYADGWTDAEVLAVYNAISTFETFLGR